MKYAIHPWTLVMLPLFAIMSILDCLFIVTYNRAEAQILAGPISSAMGGSGRAGIEMTEAGILNPALLGLAKKVEVEAFYQSGKLHEQKKLSNYGVSLVDGGGDSIFPGAFTYAHTYARYPNTLNHTGTDIFHLGFGEFLNKKFSLGIGGYFAESKFDYTKKKLARWNGQIGLMYLLTPDFGVAYVFDNIFRKTDIQVEEEFLAQQHSVGLYYRVSQIARFRADAVYSDQRGPRQMWNWHLGYDSPISDFLTLRLGAFWKNSEDQRGWSAGVSFDGPNLKVGYSFQKQEENGGGALHGVDIRIAF